MKMIRNPRTYFGIAKIVGACFCFKDADFTTLNLLSEAGAYLMGSGLGELLASFAGAVSDRIRRNEQLMLPTPEYKEEEARTQRMLSGYFPWEVEFGRFLYDEIKDKYRRKWKKKNQ